MSAMKIKKSDDNVIILPGAFVVGDVSFGTGCSVWFNSVLRGDSGSIRLGNYCHIEDNCTLHGDGVLPTILEDGVTVGHNAIVHSCTIGAHTLVGMGSIIISGAIVGSKCLIGAGSIITGKMVIPDGVLVAGNPARIVRPLTDKELAYVEEACHYYHSLAQQYRDIQFE